MVFTTMAKGRMKFKRRVIVYDGINLYPIKNILENLLFIELKEKPVNRESSTYSNKRLFINTSQISSITTDSAT